LCRHAHCSSSFKPAVDDQSLRPPPALRCDAASTTELALSRPPHTSEDSAAHE
jgi:hypothetical protein